MLRAHQRHRLFYVQSSIASIFCSLCSLITDKDLFLHSWASSLIPCARRDVCCEDVRAVIILHLCLSNRLCNSLSFSIESSGTWLLFCLLFMAFLSPLAATRSCEWQYTGVWCPGPVISHLLTFSVTFLPETGRDDELQGLKLKEIRLNFSRIALGFMDLSFLRPKGAISHT